MTLNKSSLRDFSTTLFNHNPNLEVLKKSPPSRPQRSINWGHKVLASLLICNLSHFQTRRRTRCLPTLNFYSKPSMTFQFMLNFPSLFRLINGLPGRSRFEDTKNWDTSIFTISHHVTYRYHLKPLKILCDYISRLLFYEILEFIIYDEWKRVK